MKKSTIIGLSIVGVVLLMVLISFTWFTGTYNTIVRLDVATDTQWAAVEAQYQRRADLIPNLVATVQGAADFESETQTQIAELRTAASQARDQFNAADTQEEQIVAARKIDEVATRFAGLNINVENYPQLQATQNFADLQVQLEGTENRISVARTRYNDAVGDYNLKLRTFPANFVGSLFGFEKESFFEANQGAENAVEVSFN